MSKEKTKKEKATETAEEVEEVKTSEEAVEAEAENSAEEKLREELEKQKDMYLRLRAEYDNYRKRTAQEKLSIYSDATAKAVTELLPLADSVVAAMSSTNGEGDAKGIELILNQLFACLEKLNVTAFGEVGDSFDPEFHNAVSMTENPDLPERSLAAVFQKGFKVGDKVIRPAMVVVANCN